ncbi:hypothetical protein IV203_020081 [Nitzschia inconspicua]|uniref:Uncharacterized protein n=1 Tax=Nitzschia inconspicua TaxID=303405 RepID=A0A9K3M227_9STRA|nr:hypothetical protein IV203_020449 [Nitzschia inconspicua]KAG7371511.1 hypothetical protein IV203_020081 [Nitzschia inconspicua]
MIHPLVRDLYKRALVVGRDYPLGLPYVRKQWKRAIRNVDNTPSCYQQQQQQQQQHQSQSGPQHSQHPNTTITTRPTERRRNQSHHSSVSSSSSSSSYFSVQCEREIRKAVGKGRFMIREMIGVIQLKKYRTMHRRYDDATERDILLPPPSPPPPPQQQ